MKFDIPININELATEYNLQIIGNIPGPATGINEIHKVEKGDIMFVDLDKYYVKSLASAATFIIIDKPTSVPQDKVLLVHPEPFKIYNSIVMKHRPIVPQKEMISSEANIHPTAIIEPNVVIGRKVEVGPRTHIQSNVTIGEFSVIGADVSIHSGSMIGTDAFYFKKEDNQFRKWRSCGRAVIHDNVEIGAGCTINKGVSGDTIIGKGSKLDSQVHMGHGSVLGEHCLLAAQVGIGGKTIIGDHVTLYGQVGIAQNLKIGNRVTVLAKSGVSKNLESDKTYFGYPAEEARTKYKELATLKSITQQKKPISIQ